MKENKTVIHWFWRVKLCEFLSYYTAIFPLMFNLLKNYVIFILGMYANVFNACSGHNFSFLLMQFSENNNLSSNEINFFIIHCLLHFVLFLGFKTCLPILQFKLFQF